MWVFRKKLIFQFNDYTYCIASNEEKPEYVGRCSKLVREMGETEIGEPVGCPGCHAWGVDNFEMNE